MTTIAFDGKTIATDGRSTVCDTVSYDNINKFYHNGSLTFALCGNIIDIRRFAKEFDPGKKTDIQNGIGGFLVRDGKVFVVYVRERLFCEWEAIHSWADGSGRDWAVAAMDHGKDAVGAVRYACTRDSGSGGVIRAMDIKTMHIRVVK